MRFTCLRNLVLVVFVFSVCGTSGAATAPGLDSKVADVNNAPSGTFAGSITCALFLQRFVEAAKSWLHVDIYGWTPSAKPARPEGGECQAARAIYKLLSDRYG